MIELLFVVCLSTDPTACEERSLLYTDVSPMACAMGAQPELAKWAEGHPKFRIAKWRCRMVDPSRRDA